MSADAAPPNYQGDELEIARCIFTLAREKGEGRCCCCSLGMLLSWHRSADLLHFKPSIEQGTVGTCFSILKESIVRGVMITPVDDQKILLVLNETAIPHDRERDPAYLLPHCWRLQDCYSCLHSQYHCSWCAIVRLPTQYSRVL